MMINIIKLTIIVTGRYLGAAHVACSKKCKIPKEIPVVFHNGYTYDYHFKPKVG